MDSFLPPDDGDGRRRPGDVGMGSDYYYSPASMSPGMFHQHPGPSSSSSSMRDDQLDDLSEKEKDKRACTNCRLAHKKCEGGHPCSRCMRLGIAHTCQYPVPKRRGRPRKKDVIVPQMGPHGGHGHSGMGGLSGPMTSHGGSVRGSGTGIGIGSGGPIMVTSGMSGVGGMDFVDMHSDGYFGRAIGPDESWGTSAISSGDTGFYMEDHPSSTVGFDPSSSSGMTYSMAMTGFGDEVGMGLGDGDGDGMDEYIDGGVDADGDDGDTGPQEPIPPPKMAEDLDASLKGMPFMSGMEPAFMANTKLRGSLLRREAHLLRKKLDKMGKSFEDHPMLGDITCASSFSQDSVFGIAIWCLWGFLSVNDVFCRILGYDRDEFLSGDMFFPQLFPAREVQERRMNCLQFAFSKDEVHVENPATFVRKDGKEVNCIFTVRAARDHNNVPLYFVGHLIPLDPVLLASTSHESAWNPQ